MCRCCLLSANQFVCTASVSRVQSADKSYWIFFSFFPFHPPHIIIGDSRDKQKSILLDCTPRSCLYQPSPVQWLRCVRRCHDIARQAKEIPCKIRTTSARACIKSKTIKHQVQWLEIVTHAVYSKVRRGHFCLSAYLAVICSRSAVVFGCVDQIQNLWCLLQSFIDIIAICLLCACALDIFPDRRKIMRRITILCLPVLILMAVSDQQSANASSVISSSITKHKELPQKKSVDNYKYKIDGKTKTLGKSSDAATSSMVDVSIDDGTNHRRRHRCLVEAVLYRRALTGDGTVRKKNRAVARHIDATPSEPTAIRARVKRSERTARPYFTFPTDYVAYVEVPNTHIAGKIVYPVGVFGAYRPYWLTDDGLKVWGAGSESKLPPLFEFLLQRVQSYYSVYKWVLFVILICTYILELEFVDWTFSFAPTDTRTWADRV